MNADECATRDLPVVIVLGVFPRILPGAIGIPARHNYTTSSTANCTHHLRTEKVVQLSTISAAYETPQYPRDRQLSSQSYYLGVKSPDNNCCRYIPW